MSDRLADLRRQRALIQEHLSWLDREIAAATQPSVTTTPPAAPSPVLTETPRQVDGSALLEASLPPTALDPESILAETARDAHTIKSDVRRGCLLYFVLALAGLAGVLLWLYLRVPARH